jgi:hypothetical protein
MLQPKSLFSDQILSFLSQLTIEQTLPAGVVVLNPYNDRTVLELCRKFYSKYYNDGAKRRLILGINPGRFGGGLTGIPFTDPVKLEAQCGIVNDLGKKTELSADFMYTMINAYGGPEKFYKEFYFSSISPLGFTKGGKNLNYYDMKDLQHSLRPFILDSLRKTLLMPVERTVCFCLGEGQNYKFLSALNDEFKFFGIIKPLPHPRFIMQYRRKKLSEHIENYLSQLTTDL